MKRIDILEGKAWERAQEEYHELHWDDCSDCGGSHASYGYCPDLDDNDFLFPHKLSVHVLVSLVFATVVVV